MSRRSNKTLLLEAKTALNNFKNEIASELGLSSKIQTQGWDNMTSKECGSIGGQMVKKMIAQAEQRMLGRE